MVLPNNIDLSQLNGLSEKEKEYALQILKELSSKGNSEKFNNLLYGDYDEIPVDIETFLHNPKYLGKGLVNEEGKFTVFPYWVETLKKIFPTNIDTAYNTVILSGAIGLGKSFVAVICMLYMLYRMLCLKDPYLHYGLQPIDKITFSVMNITMDAAKGVAWDKLQQLLQSSEWFMNHGRVSKSLQPEWQPEKGIELKYGSQPRHVIGRAVYCLDGDTKIATTEGIYKLNELVNKPIKVFTYDDAGDITISDTCTVMPTIESAEEYQIELEDGSVIKCTPNHKFMLTDGSYKEAQYLTLDDELMDVNRYGYVYKTTNTINNKIYIGQHKSHTFDSKYVGSGYILKNAIKKYGKDKFKVEILCWCTNKKQLDLFEKMYIKKHNSTNSDIGYNIADGGQGGDLGEVVNKKISFSLRNNGNHYVMKNMTSVINENHDIIYIPKDSPIPDGYHRGNTITNKIMITSDDNKTSKFIDKEELIPPGYHIGSRKRGVKKSEETRQRMKEAAKYRHPNYYKKPKGKKCITDGVSVRYIYPHEQIPHGWHYGNCHTAKKHDMSGWTQSMHDRRSVLSSGSNNPMYKKGYKISGGKNGKAIKMYMIDNKVFDCRKELLAYIQCTYYPTISISTVTKIENRVFGDTIHKRYPYVVENLKWWYKCDEDKINK